MKTLVIVAHPNLEQSKVNKAWAERLKQEETVTVHNLYAEYPDFKIDVAKEQQLLLDHDRIVFQFPFYWYSSPALLKQWLDDVLTYGFAYGSSSSKLQDKELMLAVSTGSPAEAYGDGGRNRYPMEELLRPFQATANLCGMSFLPPFLLQGVMGLEEAGLPEKAEAFVAYLLNSELQTAK
ncbi:NAD(P)H-dependent oxidoreductase [Paenibacillus pasadenensis]|uniref:NAD(P)H-dependent oxidoreductase n=1 Tax=Paenibacillus pasadenensis TaxID=217090 RepID=UPI0020401716|nr:NAD(P)H-dependent oxidoreductase [Paenibacillus pasadenensis]MCM3749819.1 NAD(P)H-dependent oxidoreductase [Paenibacillus pasadenensis]